MGNMPPTLATVLDPSSADEPDASASRSPHSSDISNQLSNASTGNGAVNSAFRRRAAPLPSLGKAPSNRGIRASEPSAFAMIAASGAAQASIHLAVDEGHDLDSMVSNRPSSNSFSSASVQSMQPSFNPNAASKPATAPNPSETYGTVFSIGNSQAGVARNLSSVYRRMQTSSSIGRHQLLHAHRIEWARMAMLERGGAAFLESLRTSVPKESVSQCPTCDSTYSMFGSSKVRCPICGQTLCSNCVSHSVPLDAPEEPLAASKSLIQPALAISSASLPLSTAAVALRSGSHALGSTNVCVLCAAIVRRWHHIDEVRLVREGALAVFLAHLLRLLGDIETLLPQFSGLALTMEQLHQAGMSADSNQMLLSDSVRVARELDEAFGRLRTYVKQLSVLKVPDEVPTLRRVVAIVSSYVFSFFQDNWITYKQMKGKVEFVLQAVPE